MIRRNNTEFSLAYYVSKMNLDLHNHKHRQRCFVLSFPFSYLICMQWLEWRFSLGKYHKISVNVFSFFSIYFIPFIINSDNKSKYEMVRTFQLASCKAPYCMPIKWRVISTGSTLYSSLILFPDYLVAVSSRGAGNLDYSIVSLPTYYTRANRATGADNLNYSLDLVNQYLTELTKHVLQNKNILEKQPKNIFCVTFFMACKGLFLNPRLCTNYSDIWDL